MRIPICAVLFLAACRTIPVTPTSSDLRLRHDATPISAELTIEIDPDLPEFQGSSHTALKLVGGASTIQIHARSLDVTTVTLVVGDRRLPGTFRQLTKEGLAELTFGETLAAGPATLELSWKAPFDASLTGLFRVEVEGKHYAFSQFEPVFARRAFPCFDEPSFKVPFAVTLRVPAGMAAITNGRELDRAAAGKWVEVHYATTRPLPSYLLTFAVGPLDVVNGPDVPKTAFRPASIPLRGVATAGKGPQLAYALARAGSILTTLEETYGVAYPYEKIDLIAVPDFAAGAMENAGAITFREWLLLVSGDSAEAEQKQAFASVTAHELAHQWFGDLVTMSWWNDLWLNEAFATWAGTRAAEKWDPKLGAGLELVRDIAQTMSGDSLPSARQIQQPIVTEDDIHNAFDGITYQKGAAVIGMFANAVGTEKFDAGVRRYLTTYAHGNATAADFLEAIHAETGVEIAGRFGTFLSQPGVPILTLDIDCAAAPKITVHQERYLPLGVTADRDRTWHFPICVRTDAGEQCADVAGPDTVIPLSGKACPAWVHPNAGAHGYYRFALPTPWLQKLGAVVATLEPAEQLAYVDSVRSSMDAGKTSFVDALTALKPLVSSTDRQIATDAVGLIRGARRVFIEESETAPYETFARGWAGALATHATFEPGQDDEQRLWRSMAAGLFASMHDPKVVAEATVRARAYLGIGGDGKLHPEAVDASLADTALSAAVDSGATDVFEAARKRLETEQDSSVRRILFSAIGSARGASVPVALDFALSPVVRASETRFISGPLTSAPATRVAGWEWFKANYDAVVKKTPEEFVGYLPWFGASVCTTDQADDVAAFFASRIDKLAGGPRELAQVGEAIRSCVVQREHVRKTLGTLLKESVTVGKRP